MSPHSSSPQPDRPLWHHTQDLEPLIERNHSGVPIQCQFCAGQSFRRSRLRANDIAQLLLMRYPVRCTRCSQRQTVSFTVAGVSLPSYVRSNPGSPSRSRPAPRPTGDNPNRR